MSNDHTPTGGDGGQPSHEPMWADGDAVAGEELDDLLAALADETRRRILAHLDEVDDDAVAFSDLVEHVADDPPGRSSTDREQVAVNLHHNHLPKLASADLVEYDPRSETVRYRNGPAVSEWLDLVRSHESEPGRL